VEIFEAVFIFAGGKISYNCQRCLTMHDYYKEAEIQKGNFG